MLKATSETSEDKGTPWFKTAVFPWVIIAIIVAGLLGIISGWQLHANQVAAIKGEVVSAQSLTKAR